jgi:hypothetical protein
MEISLQRGNLGISTWGGEGRRRQGREGSRMEVRERRE